MRCGYGLGCVSVEVNLVILKPLLRDSLVHACFWVLFDADSLGELCGLVVVHLTLARLVLGGPFRGQGVRKAAAAVAH